MSALKYVQTNTLYQAGSGNSIGATSIVLTSCQDIYGNVLTMTDFGAKGYGTCEPDTNSEEAFTFTGITANGNGTYSLTGVCTALARSPYTETSQLIRQHAGGTKIVITDNVAFWNTFVNKNNNETISGLYTFPSANIPIYDGDPTFTTNRQIVDKKYVDDQVSAGVADASDTTKGKTKLDTAPASPTNPIAIGVNSALLTSYSGTAINGTSNKIVDTGAVALTGNSKILLLTAGGKVTTSTIDTGTGANQIVQLDGSAKLPAVDGSALMNLPASHLLAQSSTQVVSNNTDTSEHNFFSVSLPGGNLGTANAVRIKMFGVITNGTWNYSLTFRFKYGSTTIWSFIYAPYTGGALTMPFECEVILYATGATNSQTGRGQMISYPFDVSNPTSLTGVRTISTNGTTATAAEDSTAAKNLIVSWQGNDTNGNSTIAINHYTVEILK